MKIESGKFYKTQGGQKVRIYATDAGGWAPIHGAIQDPDGWKSYAFKENGEIATHNSTGMGSIVAEWFDKPVVDWSAMPAWANKAVVKDNLGKWWAFDGIPAINERLHDWYLQGGECVSIPEAYAPKWTGDWRESLVERPAGKLIEHLNESGELIGYARVVNFDPNAIAPGHNPDRLTNAQVEVRDGWRLLEVDECNENRLIRGIQWWSRKKWTSNEGGFFSGGCVTCRTKLSREELAQSRT